MDIKGLEVLKVELSKAVNIAKNDLSNANANLEKAKENEKAGFKKESEKSAMYFSSLSMAISLTNSSIEAKAEAKANEAKAEAKAKKIKIMSNRRLKINGVLLAYKEISEIDNTDEAKRCLKSGLIVLV